MKHLATLILISFRIIAFGQSNNWTEGKLKEHWKKNGADEIEGIYSREIRFFTHADGLPQENTSQLDEEMFYIIKTQDKYTLSDFSGKNYWFLAPTYNGSKFLMTTNQSRETVYSSINTYLLRTNASELTIDNYKYHMGDTGDNYMILSDRFTLLYKPKNETALVNEVNSKSTGTGFAINSGGLIATNYHVIENANQIKIKGINGDFTKTYSATVVAKDKNNDLAIIKITDVSFSSLGNIPYLINSTTVDIGSSVNALGYPLIATMGADVKYNNGTISSKSGFQGDITSYQISVPIQPGNSGGPLFDKKGNIIGIVNAKHLGAENVGYAVKSNYLLSLIGTLPTAPKLQSINTISTKVLSEQIKSIQKFVYIIEIN